MPEFTVRLELEFKVKAPTPADARRKIGCLDIQSKSDLPWRVTGLSVPLHELPACDLIHCQNSACHQCLGCGSPICEAHTYDDERQLCLECSLCAVGTCGRETDLTCEGCGRRVCTDHGTHVDEEATGDNITLCSDCLGEAAKAPVVPEPTTEDEATCSKCGHAADAHTGIGCCHYDSTKPGVCPCNEEVP